LLLDRLDELLPEQILHPHPHPHPHLHLHLHPRLVRGSGGREPVFD
jgi:hypothetical protein